MVALDIDGDGTTACPDLVSLSIQPGATVTVTNIAGGTINYYSSIDGAATTITTGNNAAFTVGPVWLSATGRTSIQIIGTGY